MKKSALIGIILLIVIWAISYEKQDAISTEVDTLQVEMKKQDIELYVKQETSAAPYEPTRGVYVGAYAETNLNLDNNIKKFEEVVGCKQAFRVFQYDENHSIQSSDILKCIANKQVPYIKVLIDNTHDINTIYRMIGNLKTSYSTPIFIELYPVTGEIMTPQEYKTHFEEAYKVIKKYIKEAVVVWSIDTDKLEDVMVYYPGNHLVDWVGLNVYLPQYKNGKKYSPDIMQSIDFWYKNFQDKKPMMISSLAVSYFSRYDHTYVIEDAKKKLTLFYEDMVHMYPRIKGIIYVDVDMKEISNQGMDDYRVTAHSQITEHMRELLTDGIFLNEIMKEEQSILEEYMKYTVPTIERKGKLYIDEEYLNHLFPKSNYRSLEVIKDLDGNKYYSLSQLLQGVSAYFQK